MLDGLNPEQRRAVETTEGPLLVLAGAGTGKTRVITFRIAYLLERGVAPEQILAMTFTNKAAGEMRERISDMVGTDAASALTIGTFHAFCVRLLRQHARELGMPTGFAICDSSDQLSLMKGVLRELRIAEQAIKPSAALGRISLHKNKLETPSDLLSTAVSEEDAVLARVYERYDEALRRSRSLDFDDLLLETRRLLAEHTAIRDKLRQRFLYVLVDEYQDTNRPQYEIVHEIASGHENLCVVGDDDQSIYGWRGADVAKILGFQKDFPKATVVRLETNYRSTQSILDAANRVIRNNSDRHEKTLRAAGAEGEAVRMFRMPDETAEASFVVQRIVEEVGSREVRFGDFAILVRTQLQPRAFEAELRARSVPYLLIGGQSFFDRKEVRDILAFLKLMANKDDEVSLLRIVNTPPRGVGKSTIDKVLAFATRQGISAARAFERGEEIGGVPVSAIDAVRSLRRTLEALGQPDPGRTLVSRLRELLEAIDYRAEIVRCYPEAKTREDRWGAVEEIVNWAENYVRSDANPSLPGFLEKLTLTASDIGAEEKTAGDRVTLMTLHAAKGLEFPRVFLVGVEEGTLPHGRACDEGTVSEERRLCYVGITRARERLTLTCCESRSRFGRRVPVSPSRFIYELKGEQPPADWVAYGASRHAAHSAARPSRKFQRPKRPSPYR
ncbi:MAG: UvrD-helicase domain-containing protein [Planctomycetota bacterium]